jgi:quinol monooxygenase YgiN
MFTRMVEIRTKPGKTNEAVQITTNKILPILKKYPGLEDVITLVSTTDPNKFVALSFWKTQQDAERYSTESFTEVRNILANYIDGQPTVTTFNVQYSMTHKVAATAA